MESRVIDARGLSCPQPVILTKKAMVDNEGESLTAIVDQAAALENVSRLAKSQGYQVEIEQKDNDYYIHMKKITGEEVGSMKKDNDIAILISSCLFGRGKDELGQILMKGFLYALSETEGRVRYLIFMNSGVYLAVEGSPVLEHLAALEEKGVEILSCGTCLDFYGLMDKLAVGKVTNMYAAVEILTAAAKVITL